MSTTEARMITTDTYREAEARHPDEVRQLANDQRTTHERLRPYTDGSLLAAVERHATSLGLTMDLAYRTACAAPAELLVSGAQFKILVTELERRGACSPGDLFTNHTEEVS